MRSGDAFEKNTVLLQDEPLALREFIVLLAQGIGGKAGAIGLVGRKTFDVVDTVGGCRGPLVRSEIAYEIRAAARYRLAPAAGIFRKSLLLEGVDFIADETGDHGRLLS